MTDQFENSDRGHEPNFVSIPFVRNAALGLFVLVAASMWMCSVLLRGLASRPDSSQATVERSDQEGESGLDPDKRANLREQRAAEERLLHCYEWLDREAGVARVPIERAMEILAKEGLPARSQEEKP